MEQDYNLQLYNGKKGYRWRFIVNGDIKCIGTDWCVTAEAAFADAKDILDNVWSIGEFSDTGSCEQ